MRIILASTSRYRKELLARIGVAFECHAPGVDESKWQSSDLSPREIAETLALEKAKAVQEKFPEAIVIGSDQLAAIGGHVLGKPGDAQRAVLQLQKLSGQTHELITAVTVLNKQRTLTHTDITRLTMENLSTEAIQRYVDIDKPFDCAGSYKIENLGIALFTRIVGEDPSAIQGLPLMAVSRLLRDLGVPLP